MPVLAARPRRFEIAPALAAAALAAPVIAVIATGLLYGGGETWAHLVSTQLFGDTVRTLALLSLVATLCLAAAVPSAWLVTMRRFPGSRFFAWALILPLAAPGYVLAYAYADLLGVAGPIQSALRETFDVTARDYWFPEIRSLPGCAFVLAAALFPYVFLTARAGFANQSAAAVDASKSLGAGEFTTLRRVVLPAARPAIAAGLALALMEAAADFGAADLLGVQTLSVGVVRAWASFGDAAAAARVALFLLAIAFALQLVERIERGAAGHEERSTRWRSPDPAVLSGGEAAMATGFCALVFLLSFGAPVAWLIWLSVEAGQVTPDLGAALRNSLALASAGAATAFAAAVAIALGSRGGGAVGRLAGIAASAGYAAPGSVLALGGLAAVAIAPFPLSSAAALGLLVWIYASRFTAAGAAPISAALGRAPGSVLDASRSLGAGPMRRALRIDLPLAAPGAAAGALILFVEILKELPATLMLRPFDWDTLAVRAHAYASDERLAAAAQPALLITVAGLAPVLLLSRRLAAEADKR